MERFAAQDPRRRGMWSRERIRASMLIYAVTDRSWLAGRTLEACVLQAIEGGATCVQLREKDRPTAEVAAIAERLVPCCRAHGIPLIIDDDVEAAARSGADGVHVGQTDTACREARARLGDDAIIGVSARTVAEALAAEEAGADYLGVGAMFSTQTKADATPVTRETLSGICRAVSIPVTAIGGLSERTIPLLFGTGADGAAIVSAIFAAADIEAATRALRMCAVRAFHRDGMK
ncbi:thiamine-phosphate diphosphorylase [Coriobacterium glomerans PW2]|uniref:Thiamine-phosphate synthase n=1 Tax=Coriobacterium glomerans (strain ATCC 49209 / DSM 20642 / JCM 10262 / PW2) TaxID=700015 RepID=F2N8E6_CORGP|nr:thiamine phosphate synthase [Coriobacterium glomerans]AEB07329.1 thiamine-phosphate diphosphorylase [Coriobacterium glomerans PW2]